jgi:translation elongation factor EF-G
VFLAEITAPADIMGGVYQVLNQRRGIVQEEVILLFYFRNNWSEHL